MLIKINKYIYKIVERFLSNFNVKIITKKLNR